VSDTGLKILVRSFSYKKRTLTDDTGHGIGFVFDMRAVDNPGRIEHMKVLSGLDSDVKIYLEEKTKMPDFINHVKGLIDITVTNFLERGFSNLTINFGCTGGQHRSVHAAEWMANYLKENYGVEVELVHMERETWVR
jgi:RNase adaptor protein for sRNA GlmZ degradation